MKKKLFISSVMYSGELEEEREFVRKFFDQHLKSISIKMFNSLPSKPILSHDIYDNVAKNDVFCLLLAREITPVVQMEFEAAELLGMPIFILLKESYRSKSLRDFLEKKIFPANHYYSYYRNVRELNDRLSVIVSLLKNWLKIYNDASIYVVNMWDEMIKELKEKPDLIYKLSPRKFEELIAKILETYGYEIILTKPTRDKGKDIIAIYKKDPIIYSKYFIETKLWIPPRKVGVPVIRGIYGEGISRNINGIIIISSTYFTQEAIHFANKLRYYIRLHDKDALPEFYNEYVRIRKL